MILYLSFQLFRRVAAALPGMEQQEPKRDTSILSSVNKYNSKTIKDCLLYTKSVLIHTHPNSYPYFIIAIKHGYRCFIS